MISALVTLWDYLGKDLFSQSGVDGAQPLHNPYVDHDPSVDRPGSVQIRRQNLHNYFSSFEVHPKVLVIGEAPGWRGCRFSGVPFTCEAQLVMHNLPFEGLSSSCSPKAHTEASATIFWQVMQSYHDSFLVWNCLPLHPHQPGLPLSNRRVSLSEVQRYHHILSNVIEILQVGHILAVGKVAQWSLSVLGFVAEYVRHPSHGGSNKFSTGVQAFFSKMGVGLSCPNT